MEVTTGWHRAHRTRVPGQSLPGFAGLVEGTLGSRQGALDMMVLANPTGYLELDENAITNAAQVGTDTVDGVPVTVYQVTLDPAQEATVSGTTRPSRKPSPPPSLS